MNKAIQFCVSFSLIVMIAVDGNAQNSNIYRSSDAVVLQRVDGRWAEKQLTGTIITLSTHSGHLKVKTIIPSLINPNSDPDNILPESNPVFLDVKMNIDPDEVQDYFISGKIFTTQGLLTVNDVTNAVVIQYILRPADPGLEGQFNISMIMQVKPNDFNLGWNNPDTKFIVKVNDGSVNRI